MLSRLREPAAAKMASFAGARIAHTGMDRRRQPARNILAWVGSLIEKLSTNPEKCLDRRAYGLNTWRAAIFGKSLLRALSEAAIWGAIRHHGLMSTGVVISDGPAVPDR